jgi:hypothetical protein
LDGGGARILLDGPTVDSPAGVAVHGSHLYWANRGNDTIGEANLDGSDPRTLVKGATVESPTGVAIGGGHIYWSNGDVNGTTRGNSIAEAALNGSGARILIKDSSVVHDPRAVAVSGDHIYWTNYSYEWISEANVNGSDPRALVNDVGEGAWGLAVTGG